MGLIAVCYGKLRLRFLDGRAASFAHRAIGDALVVVIIVVAVTCVSYLELDDEAVLHVVAAGLLLVVLALKIAVVRWHRASTGSCPCLGARSGR